MNRSGIFLTVALFLTASTMAPKAFPQASQDGNYVMASVSKTLDGTDRTLVVQSTTGTWKREIATQQYGAFTPDGTRVIYQAGERLCVLTLGTEQQLCFAEVASYLQPATGTGEWLAYLRKGADKELVLRDLTTGKDWRIQEVTSYFFVGDRALVVSTAGRQEATSDHALHWLDLSTGEDRVVWSDRNAVAGQFVFHVPTQQLAFLVQERAASETVSVIWHYRAGSEKAQPLVENGLSGIDAGLVVANDPFRFSPTGSKLFFKLREKDLPRLNPKRENIDIWSYLDSREQSLQLKDLCPRYYAAVVSVDTRRIVRLEEDNEVLLAADSDESSDRQDDFALVARFNGDVLAWDDHRPVEFYSLGEYNWNKATISRVYLVSTKDGTRTLLKSGVRSTSASFPYFRLSPEGRYVVYYSSPQNEYVGYEISRGKSRNLTRGIPTTWVFGEPEERPGDFYIPRGILGWIEGETAVLLQDHYGDIWQVNLSGRAPPYNVTNGFARRNRIELELSYERDQRVFKSREEITLIAHTTPNAIRHMHDGYYIKPLDGLGDPQPLIKIGGAYAYTVVKKALHGSVYVVRRENADEAPNAYYTRDFRVFTPITGSQPEQRTPAAEQELVTWKTFDGTLSQGVLYKPSDFDRRKRYPIVLSYYEKFGTADAAFDRFRFTRGSYKALIDAGYLVFVPDIHYTIGHTGRSAYNSVVSAAKVLAKRAYVDAKHMGLIGTSFSGYETNYIVAHTHEFAAAQSCCGVSDFFSYYGTEEKDEQGRTYATSVEHGQERLGVTPWDRPDLYLENSPIFSADKVTTPLLLFHNDRDFRVPFSQGVEFFKALRRLGKRAWLINHEGAGHGSDITWKFSLQFLDHYLKGAPAPKWMTRGVPARTKAIDDGTELDSEIETPPLGGLLMEAGAKTPQQQKLLETQRSHQ